MIITKRIVIRGINIAESMYSWWTVIELDDKADVDDY